MVIQECEDPARSTRQFQEWAGDYLWAGETKNKGIGIFDRACIGIAQLDWASEGLQSFLPCTVGNELTLIGVWTKYAESPNFRYIGQFWKYFQIHKKSLAAGPVLICGDFNSNACWDEWDRWWNHSDVVRELGEIGIESLYHQVMNERQGLETRATLYHRKDPQKPYHVDYAFCSTSLIPKAPGAIKIGEASNWLEFSDHMPVVFQI